MEYKDSLSTQYKTYIKASENYLSVRLFWGRSWKTSSIKGRGFAKRWSYLISLFSKSDDEGGRGCQKSQKIDDVFYEWPLSDQNVGKYEFKVNLFLAQ